MKPTKLFLIVLLLCIFSLNSKAQWSSDPAINTAIVIADGEQAIPLIASSPFFPGISYVAWFSSESGNYNVRLQKLDAYGNKLWVDEGILVSNHPAMTWLTDWDIIIDGNDCAILTFQDIRTGDNNIVVYKISPDGTFLWGADGIQLSNSTAFDASPKVCVTAAGNTIVAWSADDVVIRQKIASDGTLLWGADGITLSGANAYSWPQLLAVGNDEVIMKYFEDIGTFPSIDRDVYAQRFDANGADVWSQATVISNAGGISTWTQIFPFINDGSDGFYIAWHDDRDNNMRASIFVQHVDANGQLIFSSNGVEVSNMSNRNHYYSHLALPQGSNSIFVYWNEMDANQNDRGIYGQKISSTGSIEWEAGGKVFIEISSTNIYPMGSCGTENDMIVIYEEYFDAVNTSVKAMRIDTNGAYIWPTEKITMCNVQSEKGHAIINNYYFEQLIAVWEDDRGTSKDIYGQNIQLDGSLGSIPPLFNASFTVSDDSICKNETVQYTDISFGTATSWNWSFEGGNPATSTSQNPNVTYNSSGTFNVELIISDGTSIDTTLITDFIFVYDVPAQANIPAGLQAVCQGINTEYTTNTVQYAEVYQWEVNPSDAGIISGTDTIGLFEPSNTWTGSYIIKVRGQNDCYDGAWSSELNCTLNMTPEIFQLTGDGAFCEGGSGSELILDGSETGVDYELLLDGTTSGIIVQGTGSEISFGFQTDEGIYTSTAFTAFCSSNMSGSIWVHEIYLPEQAAIPEGNETVCNNSTSIYTTLGAANSDLLIWTLIPTEAGIITAFENELSIDWNISFSGTANLSVQGVNECGLGPVSDELQIEVISSPLPEISGDTLVCQNYQGIIYNTIENSGNIYIWEIDGGEIVSGINTSEISVNWGNPGQGWVKVTEENPEECTSTTEDYLVIIDECTSIEEINSEDILIFPNPANEILNIKISSLSNSKVEIKISDVMGRIMKFNKTETNNGIVKINISDLQNGIYSVEIVNTNFGKITKRFIVN